MSPSSRDALVSLATSHGYASLALLSFVDGMGAPLPAELVLLALHMLIQHGAVDYWPALLTAAAANTAGALVPYAVARRGGTLLAGRLLPSDPRRRQRLERWVAGYGPLALAAARATGLFRLAAVVLAGMYRLPLPVVATACFLGTCLWVVSGLNLLKALGARSGYWRERLEERWWDLALAALLLAVLGVAAACLRRLRAPARRSE